tara:strand:- start:2681 stop:6178 length:3498 start_codon:yes stop_codon:yes gene_type:complete
MNILELDSYNLDDAVKFNEHLNPRLWGKDRRLQPDVREHLLKIADDFREFLGVSDFELKDITVSGSNAAYTYTPKSDVDLHLVVDLPQADASEVYRELFDAKKFQYNEQHNITIGGYPVELYVQDANKKHISQGIYSVLNNAWIDVPKRKDAGVDDISTRSKYEDLATRIDAAIKSENYESMASLMNKIKTMRQTGLDQHGEFGPENLAFKMLRNQGAIERLVNARTAAKDRELSLREREKVKQRVHYGFATEDAGGTWDGVSATTQMFLNEKPELSDAEIVSAFIDYCVQQLGIEQTPVVKFKKDPQWSARNKTFGRYSPDQNLLEVSLADRHVMDILRTVAHELTHTRQHEVEDVPNGAGETGSRWENEANARAGVLMRDYAQQHPEFFEAGEIDEGIKDKIAGAALAACVAGTAGCATTEPFNKGAEAVKAAVRTSQISKDDLKYGATQGLKNILRRAANANESSGYIPTKKQAKDPRFVMALTRDVQPGAVGKEANKLGLQTDSQGHPELLMKNLANALREFKEGKPLDKLKVKESKEQLAEEDVFEVSMRPSMLRQAAANINAKAGMEFEMYVPDTAGADEDYGDEPDMDSDESSRSWSNIEEFFLGGDGANGRRDVQRAIQELQEEFFEWGDEKIQEDWAEEQFDMVKEWVINNVQDEDILDFGEYNDEDRAKFEEDPDFKRKVITDYVDNAIEKQTDDYDSAREEYMDEQRGDLDEQEWLDEAYPSMSDILTSHDLNWPHYSYNERGGDTTIEEVADSFKSEIGKPVTASSNYHSAERNDTDYIVEPDGSLDQPDNSSDGGLEFISPPMPVAEMFSDMDKIVNWANNYGCYTNKSTGLHMNISVPGMSTAKLDFVKLALLMGDEYVLEKFERLGNYFAKSAMQTVRERVAQRPEDATAMLEQMKERLNALATKVIHSGETSKYTSINTKDGYVEFRSPGGDWLASYNEDKGNIENTMLRFVVALDAAMDPEKYRNEYLKKLYKLLAPKGENDTLAYFAKFAAGELPASALKSFVRQAQLERQGIKDTYNELQPEPAAGSIQYDLYNTTTDQVYRTFYAANDEMALDMGTRYREELRAANPGVLIGVRRTVAAAAPDQQQAAGGEFTGQWLVKDAQGREIHRFGGIGNSQSDANRVAMEWLRSNPSQMTDGVEVVPEMR